MMAHHQELLPTNKFFLKTKNKKGKRKCVSKNNIRE
jgi:hypothetical protein